LAGLESSNAQRARAISGACLISFPLRVLNDFLDDGPRMPFVAKTKVVSSEFVHPFISERSKVLGDRRNALIMLNDSAPLSKIKRL
jgi:hypothetical protein